MPKLWTFFVGYLSSPWVGDCQSEHSIDSARRAWK